MQFQRERLTINGIAVTMLTAGQGDPLLFLHGAGTWHGFEFAKCWAERFRVLIPFHPNFAESADADWMTSPHDYVMHTLELMDQVGLDQVHLAGLSMGGRLAAQFTAEHRRRVRKLAVVAPAGLDVPGYELADFRQIPPEQIPSYLAHDPSILVPYLADAATPEWQAARAREGGSMLRLIENGLIDPHFSRWLHRVTVPTLIVWGENDRVTPVQQCAAWERCLPNAKVMKFANAGHLVLDEKPEAPAAIRDFLVDG